MKIEELGYDSLSRLSSSTFHPECYGCTITISMILATLAGFFETYVGIEPAVGAGILLLFIIEVFTGIGASVKEKKPVTSRRFWGGFIKLGIYTIMIGASHLLANGIEIKDFMGVSFNIYEWIHYFFLNFTILQLFISNIENFRRLGWGEFVPVINKIAEFLKLEDKPKNKK